MATRNFPGCRSFSARHHDRDIMTGDITRDVAGEFAGKVTGKVTGNIAGLGREKPTCQY